MRYEVLTVILGMAIAAYLTRIVGFWIIGRLRETSQLLNRIRYVPCAVLAAILAPPISRGEIAECIGMGVAILSFIATRNFLISLCISVLLVALLRSSI